MQPRPCSPSHWHLTPACAWNNISCPHPPALLALPHSPHPRALVLLLFLSHAACSYGCVAVAQWLLAQGADANIRDADGDTPLFYCEDTRCADLLMSAGADVAAVNAAGHCAYFASAWESREPMLEWFRATCASARALRPQRAPPPSPLTPCHSPPRLGAQTRPGAWPFPQSPPNPRMARARAWSTRTRRQGMAARRGRQCQRRPWAATLAVAAAGRAQWNDSLPHLPPKLLARNPQDIFE